jgi:hypothetical protein
MDRYPKGPWEEKQQIAIPQIGARWGQSGAFMEKEMISLKVSVER